MFPEPTGSDLFGFLEWRYSSSSGIDSITQSTTPQYVPGEVGVEVRGEDVDALPVGLGELLLVEVAQVEVDDGVVEVLALLEGAVVAEEDTLALVGNAPAKRNSRVGYLLVEGRASKSVALTSRRFLAAAGLRAAP